MGMEEVDSQQQSEQQQTAAPLAGDVNFPIIGIGASAGGFRALATLLRNMPPESGMALVVILHLASGPSAADKVLQRATGIPVVQVTHTMPILPDKVYVIPPDRCLKMSDGHLVLDELERRAARPVAVDIFLRTLAEAHGERAVGVVLSGMGSDGTAGLACIKELGGVTIAQLPADAEEGAMPRSAIESGMADFVLPAGEIPHKLVELRDIACRIRQHARPGKPPDGGPLFDLGAHPQAALREVLALLRARTGHDFSHYRRPTLQRRLERRLQVRGLPDLASYCRLLQKDAGEAQALLKDLLIGVTSFFRDREAFAALDRTVLAALFAAPDEAAEAGQLFEPVDAVRRIYRARPGASRRAGVAALPAAPQTEAPLPAPPPAPWRRRGRLYSFAEIHLHKAAGLAPPSVLLDARGDIVHVSEAAARFLRPPGGEPTREAAALVLPELQLPLRVALFQARGGGDEADGHEVRTGPVRYERGGAARAVDMLVLPFRDQHADGQLMLLQFHEMPGEGAPAPTASPEDRALARQLDDELCRTRRQLREAVEHAEQTSGELRIYTEEMQTTNDELRAQAEEAERGRELLASRVLELEAGNRELQAKAEEAAKSHDDLANLIASSGVATIFLDRAMRIVRFTPRIADFFNVIPADIGRPLQHITNSFDYPRLAGDAARVFDTLQAMEREVRGKDGRDYIVRVHPYRTTTHRIDGAVMTFFDVTEHKRTEQAQRESDARLAALFESLPVGVGVFDGSGDITMSNEALHRFLPTCRMPSRDPARVARWRAWDADGRPLRPEDFPGARALRGERVVPGIEMLYTGDDGRETWTQVASAPVVDAGGKVIGQGVTITDIDALKRSEEALRENERRLRELAGEFAQMVWETGPDGMVTTDSPSWRAYTGQTLDEWLGMGWLDAVHPDDRAYAARQWSEAVAARRLVNACFRVRRADGAWRLTKVRAAPLAGADGCIRKWVGINVEVDGEDGEVDGDGPAA